MTEFNIEDERPLFQTWKPIWQMYEDFAEFGPDVLYGGKYLTAHPREQGKDFNQRAKRSDNYNLIPEILNVYKSYQFGELPKRTIKGTYKAQIEAFLADTNRNGRTMDEFMQEAYLAMLTYGGPELFVDMPVIEDILVTQQQVIESEATPYVRIMPPIKRTQWGVDQFGEYYWVVYKQEAEDSIDPEVANEPESYLLLRPTGWQVWTKASDVKDATYSVTRDGDYKFGKIPLVPFFKQFSKKYKRFGVSALQEAAPTSKAILNLISQQQQDIFASFSIVAFQTDSDIEAPSELGATTALTYPTDAKNPPMYLTVPVEHIKVKQEVIDAKVEMIIRSAKLSSSIGELSHKVSRSGIAGEVERRELYAMLKELARNCEHAERNVISFVVSWLAGKYVSPDETGFEVHYNDVFRLESNAELLELTEKVQSLYKTISPTFTKETMKMLPKSSLREGGKVLDTVEDEINNADVAEIDLIPVDSEEI